MSTVKSLLSTREGYTRFKPLLEKLSRNLGSYEQQLLSDISHYYSLFPNSEQLDDKFSLWFFNVRHPSLSEAEKGLYKEMLAADEDKAYADELYQQLHERATLEKLLLTTEDVISGVGNKTLSDILSVVQELGDNTDSSLNRFIVPDNTRELVQRVYGQGLDWKQMWMNQSCGPLRKGDFVALVARPDTGKTSFLANQVVSFAKQLTPDDVVLWLNNEQEGGKVRVRIKQVGTEMKSADIIRSPDTLDTQFKELTAGGASIVVVDKGDVSKLDIEGYYSLYGDRIKAIIIDQAWKLHGYGQDNSDVATQTRIAKGCRDFAKRIAPVIGVYQADASAEGESYFGMDKVYMVKTALQGEADLVICMGRSFAEGKEKSRFFSFPKNKMAGGGKYFQESMRQWKHEATFIAETGVFR